MTINTAITVLGMIEAHGICIEAKEVAVNTMRKYQTMQEVLEKVWNMPPSMLDESDCLNKIMETYRTVRYRND